MHTIVFFSPSSVLNKEQENVGLFACLPIFPPVFSVVVLAWPANIIVSDTQSKQATQEKRQNRNFFFPPDIFCSKSRKKGREGTLKSEAVNSDGVVRTPHMTLLAQFFSLQASLS